MSIEKLNEISFEIAASKKKLQEFALAEGKSVIGAAFAKCFEPPTNLKAITWKQYTPYFNDGEACVFGVNDPYLHISDDDDSEDDYGDGKKSFDTYMILNRSENAYAKEKRALLEQAIGEASLRAFLELWPKLSDDILEAVFGDHVKIKITKDEVVVESYDHE